MNPALESTLTLASTAIEAARREVRRAEGLGAGASGDNREAAARARSAAYVFMSAALERCVKDSLGAILVEINTQGVALSGVRTSLFALLCSGDLAFIRSSGNRKSLDRHARAADMFARVLDPGGCVFPTAILPLDGRTLRAAHFETLWIVFGFPAPALPHPAYSLALSDLADGRNDVAHGLVDPVAFGRGKATPDVARLVDRIEDVILHVVATADDYLASRRYAR